MTTKTRPAEANEIKVGDRLKFGKDDFRTVARVGTWREIMGNGPDRFLYAEFDAATVPAGAMQYFDLNSRKHRVAV